MPLLIWFALLFLAGIFKVFAAMSAGLGKGNYKITDRYSANGMGLVLYYYGIFMSYIWI
jgi:hypothetical protein